MSSCVFKENNFEIAMQQLLQTNDYTILIEIETEAIVNSLSNNEIVTESYNETVEYGASLIDQNEVTVIPEAIELNDASVQTDDVTTNGNEHFTVYSNFVLNTKDDLIKLINLEEKCIIPKYKMRRNTMDGTDRACICRLIVKNLLKNNPEKE